MFSLKKYPNINKDILRKFYNCQNLGDIDGFDDAYNDGLEVILKVINDWDGGISENFLLGIHDGLTFIEELQEKGKLR